MRRQWVYLIPKKRNTHERLLAAVVAIMAVVVVAAVAFFTEWP